MRLPHWDLLGVFLHLFARFNMYRLFVFICQFLFLCTENFHIICGNFSLLKNMNGKINTNTVDGTY